MTWNESGRFFVSDPNTPCPRCGLRFVGGNTLTRHDIVVFHSGADAREWRLSLRCDGRVFFSRGGRRERRLWWGNKRWLMRHFIRYNEQPTWPSR